MRIVFWHNGGVAQLVSASDCRSEGCEFEPRRPRQNLRAPAPKAGAFLLRLLAEAKKYEFGVRQPGAALFRATWRANN